MKTALYQISCNKKVKCGGGGEEEDDSYLTEVVVSPGSVITPNMVMATLE